MRPLAPMAISGLLAAATAQAASFTSMNLTVDGKSRNMLVCAPSGLTNPPVILQLHGMNQDAAYQQAQAKWETMVDTGKFIVVLPNGENKSWDISGTKDVNFMSAIIDEMVKKYGADRNRIYISGFSMGGMFTYHAMNKMADKIAAFAPCSGYPMGGTTASGNRPLPIIHIHGTSDDVVGYSGVEGALSKWRTQDGCPSNAVVTKPYPPNKSSSVTTKYAWGPCTKNGATVEVVHLANTGKGHWYSMDQASALSSVEIWNFVKKYSLNSTSGVATRTPDLAGLVATYAEGAISVRSPQALRAARVLDLQGKEIAHWKAGAEARTDLSIPVGGALPGLYVLDIAGIEGRTTRTLALP